MKTTTSIFLLIWASLNLLAAQPPNVINNAGFENWEADTLYHLWEGYNTTNVQSYYAHQVATTSSVAAPMGEAARLTTHIIGTDTFVGNLILGAFCPTGFLGGMAYSERPDSVFAWIRHEVSAPDYGSLVLIYKRDDTVKGFNFFPIQGNQPAFYRFARALSPPAGTYNQLSMLIQSGTEDQSIDGSWLEIDSIALGNSMMQPPNPSFNEVELLHYEDPEGWASPNISLGLFGNVTGVSKSTDAYDGMYAARIQTVSYISNCEPDTFGFLGDGSWHVIDGQTGGQPISFEQSCMKFGGYYKYDAVGNDTALVGILFTRYDSLTEDRDTVYAMTQALPPAMNYEAFELVFSETDFIIPPDSFHLVFQSSDESQFASQAVRGAGSTLWIDSLYISPCIGDGLAERPILNFQLYPNPASTYTRIAWEAQAGHRYELRVVDLQGKTLLKALSSESEIQLDIAKLPSGLYFVSLRDLADDSYSSLKLIKR